MPTFSPDCAHGVQLDRAQGQNMQRAPTNSYWRDNDPCSKTLALQIVDPHSADPDGICMQLDHISDEGGMISAFHSLDTTPRTSVDLSSKPHAAKFHTRPGGVNAAGMNEQLVAALSQDLPLGSLDELTGVSNKSCGLLWNTECMEPATPCKASGVRTSLPEPKLQHKAMRKLEFDDHQTSLNSSNTFLPFLTHELKVRGPRSVAPTLLAVQAVPGVQGVQALPRKLSWRGRRGIEQRQIRQGDESGVRRRSRATSMDIEHQTHQPITATGTPEQLQSSRGSISPDTYDPMYPDTVHAGELLSGGVMGKLHTGVLNGMKVAVKVISTNLSSSVNALTRFKLEQEAATGMSLTHPHIIKTFSASMYAVASTDAYRIQPLPLPVPLTGSPSQATTIMLPAGVLGAARLLNRSSIECKEVVGRQHRFDGGYFAHIVMELCPLGSLRQMLDGHALVRSGRVDHNMDMNEVLPLALEMASAMAFMHTQGLIHGDFKAANIMIKSITDDNAAVTHRKFTSKVIDFGNTRSTLCSGISLPTSDGVIPPSTPKANPKIQITNARSSSSSDGSAVSSSSNFEPTGLPGLGQVCASIVHSCLVGTPSHAAPELLLSNAKTSPATDVYSLGVTLWELFTGGKPYSGYTLGDLLLAKKHPTSNMLLFPNTVPFLCQRLCTSCWGPPASRPPISQILSQLSTLCETYAPPEGGCPIEAPDMMQ